MDANNRRELIVWADVPAVPLASPSVGFLSPFRDSDLTTLGVRGGAVGVRGGAVGVPGGGPASPARDDDSAPTSRATNPPPVAAADELTPKLDCPTSPTARIGWFAAASPMPSDRSGELAIDASLRVRAAADPFSFVGCDASSAGSLGTGRMMPVE